MQWYSGPWVWDTSVVGRPYWRAPRGTQGIDLRTLPEQSIAGGIGHGRSLFFGELSENKSDYELIGSGSWNDIRLSHRNLHLIRNDATGDTLRNALLSTLTNEADPDGFEAPRPLVPTTHGTLELSLGGWHHSQRTRLHEHPRVLDMHRREFGSLFEQDQRTARKVLDFWCHKYGRNDWKAFVPSRLLPHVEGRIPHETTITDTFDRANSGVSLGTASGGFTYAIVNGMWGILSNSAYCSSAIGWSSAQAQSDLSSTDHYSQVTIDGTGDNYQGPACRVNGSALTFYQFSADATRYLFKLVSGTQTVLTSSSGGYTTNQVWKCEANGSAIKGYINGSQILSATDTAISSGVRAGFAKNGTSGEAEFKDFTAADLVVAPVNTVAPAVTGTAQVGQTLTTTNGTWSNTPTSYSYLWKHGDDSAAAATATNNTYVSAAGDIGFGMKCVVTASNAGGSAAATSNATSNVLPAVPVNSVAPAVTGTAQVGQTLTTTTGTWSNTPSSYAYLWKHDDDSAASSTATNSTYVPVAGDIAFGMKCVVTASNAGGPGSPATSNTTSDVLPAAPTNTLAPSTTPTSGTTASSYVCSSGTWTGSPDEWYWQTNKDGSGLWLTVSTEQNPTLTFVSPGTYETRLIAGNAGGYSDPATGSTLTVSAESSGSSLTNNGLRSSLSGLHSRLSGL